MKYIIYKITIQDYIYVGSTKNFTRRKCEHKRYCNIKKDVLIYNKINELGGWDNCSMIPIEEGEFENNIQAHIREEVFRKEYHASLNTVRCHATCDDYKERRTQYNEVNKDKIRIQKKIYKELHKDEIKENNKEYRSIHKESQKEYYELNKDKINARKKELYKEKKNNTV